MLPRFSSLDNPCCHKSVQRETHSEGVIAELIFNGYGLGLYGTIGALGCFGIAVGVYLVTHVIAAIWLSWFKQGPLEVVLRWITRSGYGAVKA